MIIDYWRLWSEKTGVALDFVAAPWDETLKMVGSGAVKAHAGLFFSKSRDQFLDYGAALRKTDTHVFFHRSIPATTEYRQLAAYRVGVLSGDYVEGFLKKRVPYGNIVGFPDYETVIEALRAGELKVFAADTPTALFHLRKAGLLGEFTFINDGPLYRSDWFVATGEGDKDTLELINRGMAQISEEEKQAIGRRWISEATGASTDDALIIAMDRAYPPFTFMNAQGRPTGLFVDLWEKWSQKTGKKVRFRPTSWTETLEGLKASEVDIHSGLSYSVERAKWLGFSAQFYETFSRIYHRAGQDTPPDINAFGDRTLGLWAGTFQEAEVRRLYPQTRIQTFTTTKDMVDALMRGEIEAFLQESQVMDAVLWEMGLQGDIVPRPERLFVSAIHAGIAKDNAPLLADINAGLSQLTTAELAEIEARWITNPDTRFHGRGMTDAEIGLTREERAWLNAHPVIRLGSDRSWAPYEYLDGDGRLQGLSAAFINRVGEILGIVFQPPPSISWPRTMDRVQNGDLDVITSVAPTKERRKFLRFTEPYAVWPNVIAIRSDKPGVYSLVDLEGKKVGVVQGYATQTALENDHTDMQVVPHRDISAGLQALSTGRIDAFVGAPATIRHGAAALKFDNVAVVARTPYTLELAFGIRKDWPELAVILDKALAKISVNERLRLTQAAGLQTRIAYTKLEQGPDALLSRKDTWMLAAVIGAALGVVLILVQVIRTQRKPFFQSLRGKSILFIGGVFVLTGGAALWALSFVGERISEQLGFYVAERQVLWHKEKVNGAIQRELALAKQMAESQLLMEWATNEENLRAAALARTELQRYHDNFRAKSFFVGLAKTGHFFYADDKVDEVEIKILDTLSTKDKDDVWFFKTLKDPAPYNLNVDHNIDLGVTNLWVNYAMRRGNENLGVVGTGIQLTRFIKDFVSQQSEGLSTMMIDSNGAIQAHVDPKKIALNVLGKEIDEKSGVWALLATPEERKALRHHIAKLKTGVSEAESFFLTVEGKTSLVAAAYLEPLGWYTLAMVEPGGLVGFEEMGALAIVLAIALAITVFVFIVGQNIFIIHPLNELSRGANRMAEGDYDVELPQTQRDEIGDLTKSFNVMSATIADYTRNLQTMVADRTNQLTAAYETISSSIDYASTIQRSVLPHDDAFSSIFSDHFVIWEPRDRVGGDIYWNRVWGDGVLVILVDCTGHGVPGAFMTLISTGALDRALDDVAPGEVGKMVQRIHQLVQLGLHQNEGAAGGSDDGLELGAVYLDADMANLTFAGARFSLFVSDGTKVEEIKGTKAGLGYRGIPHDQTYAEKQITVASNSAYYMTTDGLTDQVGGEKTRMFGKKRLRALLAKIHSLPMPEQETRIRDALESYQGDNARRDDVSMIGFTV